MDDVDMVQHAIEESAATFAKQLFGPDGWDRLTPMQKYEVREAVLPVVMLSYRIVVAQANRDEDGDEG